MNGNVLFDGETFTLADLVFRREDQQNSLDADATVMGDEGPQKGSLGVVTENREREFQTTSFTLQSL